MDKPLVAIIYKLARGNEICIDVSPAVKELFEESIRKIRSQRRQDRRHLVYVDCMEGLTDTAIAGTQEDIAHLVIRMETYDRLYANIEKLSELQQRRLLLHFFQNMTYRQIAALESVNQSVVGNSIRRAIENLRECFAE